MFTYTLHNYIIHKYTRQFSTISTSPSMFIFLCPLVYLQCQLTNTSAPSQKIKRYRCSQAHPKRLVHLFSASLSPFYPFHTLLSPCFFDVCLLFIFWLLSSEFFTSSKYSFGKYLKETEDKY